MDIPLPILAFVSVPALSLLVAAAALAGAFVPSMPSMPSKPGYEQKPFEDPVPRYLKKHDGKVNVGIVGHSSAGKAVFMSQIRAMCKCHSPPALAKAASKPVRYSLPNEPQVALWDLGAPCFPWKEYILQMGLHYYDAILIFTSENSRQEDKLLKKNLERHGVPVYVVPSEMYAAFQNDASVVQKPAMSSSIGGDDFGQAAFNPEQPELPSLFDSLRSIRSLHLDMNSKPVGFDSLRSIRSLHLDMNSKPAGKMSRGVSRF